MSHAVTVNFRAQRPSGVWPSIWAYLRSGSFALGSPSPGRACAGRSGEGGPPPGSSAEGVCEGRQSDFKPFLGDGHAGAAGAGAVPSAGEARSSGSAALVYKVAFQRWKGRPVPVGFVPGQLLTCPLAQSFMVNKAFPHQLILNLVAAKKGGQDSILSSSQSQNPRIVPF